MPVAPTVITQNFLTGADVNGLMLLVDGQPALFGTSWISAAGGQTLISRPATVGGAILDPSELARRIDRGSRGMGKYDPATDAGGSNQFGYSVHQINAVLPGATAATLELVNTFAALATDISVAAVLSPAPDGIRKKFEFSIPANSIPNTVKFEFSNGFKFVDDGNGLFVRIDPNGVADGPSPRCGYCEYGTTPFSASGVARIEFAVAPPVGTTGTRSGSNGGTPAVVAVWTPTLPQTADAFVWGADKTEGPISVPVGFYLRIVATPVLTGAGHLTAFVGGLQTQGYGANVYGFAKRERAI
jgi:hypothetical protein